jgi:dinuclear metal center YbgI/SA1388 family protein
MGCLRETVVQALAQIAPEFLAEPWDNVGFIVDPGESLEFTRAFVTVDLTDTTLDEALEHQADFILAYHPPIFGGLKRLRFHAPSERVVLRALRAGLTIFSPHTALDAVQGGMTDWLARAVGPGRMHPIVPHSVDTKAGAGRLIRLDRPVAIENAVAMVKAHLGLNYVRLSEADRRDPVVSVAVCPGAGGSVFEKLDRADLLITGEMRHHDVLARKARGTHVILTDHTNTERGYLPILGQDLARACPGLDVIVSRLDADPLQVK